MRKLKELERLAEGAGEAVGILQLGKLDGHALVVVAHHATPHAAENDHRINRRLDASMAIEAPLNDTSMTLQSWTSPFGKISFEALIGHARRARACAPRRGPGFLVDEPGQRDWRSARAYARLARMRTAKPPSKERTTTPSMRPRFVEIGDNALPVGAGDGREQRHASGRHIDDFARIFLFVVAHEAAEHAHRHAAVAGGGPARSWAGLFDARGAAPRVPLRIPQALLPQEWGWSSYRLGTRWLWLAVYTSWPKRRTGAAAQAKRFSVKEGLSFALNGAGWRP